MLVSLAKNSNHITISRKIAKLGADYGLGVTFGNYQVRQVLIDVKNFVDKFLLMGSNPLPILVTSYPGENDIMDLFEEQLNPFRGAKPEESGLLTFLASILSITEVESMLVALWDSAVPELNSKRIREMNFEEFRDRLRRYYDGQSPSGEKTGVFRISK